MSKYLMAGYGSGLGYITYANQKVLGMKVSSV